MTHHQRRRWLAVLSAFLLFAACSPTTAAEGEMLPRIGDYTPSAADWERLAAANKQYAESMDIVDPPDFEVIAWIDPEDVPSVRTPCMAALGVDVKATETGYTVTAVNDEVWLLAKLADYQCSAQYPVRQDIRRPPEGDEIRQFYDHYADVFLPCLDKAGYPGAKLPSYSTFEDMLKRSHGEVMLDIYEQLLALYPDQQDEIADEISTNCPAVPDGFRAYQR